MIKKPWKTFGIIFLTIFILQLPGCIIVVLDDAGGIEYYGNKTLILAAGFLTEVFSFPLFSFFKENVKSILAALLLYVMNLALLSLVIYLIFGGIKAIRQKSKGTPSQPSDL